MTPLTCRKSFTGNVYRCAIAAAWTRAPNIREQTKTVEEEEEEEDEEEEDEDEDDDVTPPPPPPCILKAKVRKGPSDGRSGWRHCCGG